LQLLNVSFRAGSETWLHPFSLTLAKSEVNVVLGATRAGKTTLLRLLAGLERPSSGRLLHKNQDVTGVPVRRRSVAMVYQQFINYPSLTVFENIASPLRVGGVREEDIRSQVAAVAELLQLSPMLRRYPAELSGGQQQRVALARALTRNADLLLLDEPLVNLDYKLREGLRDELAQIFAQRQATVVYTTTDPQEALQLGGHTHVLHEGRLLQSGPTLQVFRRPATLEVARAFSDPPLNVLPGRLDPEGRQLQLADGSVVPLPSGLLSPVPPGTLFALRPHQLSLTPRNDARSCITGVVQLSEISGSETYMHMSAGAASLVAQLPGVHQFELGQTCTLYFTPEDMLCFDPDGALLRAVER
jgi:glycerol transport system ATP-binding protein